jgi:beta-glucosidase
MLIKRGPLSVNYIAQSVPAILEGFYLGQETGVAVADVLFGDYNPAGKLSVSIPRSVGQLRSITTISQPLNAVTCSPARSPLFPFGYGLSYTSSSTQT